MHGNTKYMIKLKYFAATVSEPEANERGSSLIGRKNFSSKHKELWSRQDQRRMELWLCANG